MEAQRQPNNGRTVGQGCVRQACLWGRGALGRWCWGPGGVLAGPPWPAAAQGARQLIAERGRALLCRTQAAARMAVQSEMNCPVGLSLEVLAGDARTAFASRLALRIPVELPS
jgi:hypothetical protein